jgi:hypothetical protein
MARDGDEKTTVLSEKISRLLVSIVPKNPRSDDKGMNHVSSGNL